MHSRENEKREVRAVNIDHFFKEFCHNEKEKKKWIIARGGSGTKKGLICFVENRKVTAYLYADGNDPGGMEQLI